MMTVIQETENWALVLKGHDYYMVRHKTCGSYLTILARVGCVCIPHNKKAKRSGKINVTLPDESILKAYQFLTGGL